MNLLTKEDALTRLQQAGVWSKKKLGQHFLVDESALETILAQASLLPSDTVVEVGPGMGVLSRRLIDLAGYVLAFEYDSDMVSILRKDLPSLNIVEGDVLRTAPEAIEQLDSYKVVANIPYQITTPLLRMFLEGGVSKAPDSMTLLVQKEVGKRLAAPAKDSARGYLSVLAQYFAEVTYAKTVLADSFFPAPKVDSAIIHLETKQIRLFPEDEERDFLKLVHRFFITPRKQLKNVISGIRGMEPAEVEQMFAEMGLPATARAQELSLDEWSDLYNRITKP